MEYDAQERRAAVADQRDKNPFRVLICDRNSATARVLDDAITCVDPTITSEIVPNVDSLLDAVDANLTGAIFIDPVSVGLSEATTVIFHIRDSDPWITFVLYVDVSEVERHRADFYRGKRSRLVIIIVSTKPRRF